MLLDQAGEQLDDQKLQDLDFVSTLFTKQNHGFFRFVYNVCSFKPREEPFLCAICNFLPFLNWLKLNNGWYNTNFLYIITLF